MPTPVSTAKQCLNPEASHALDEAVSLARRRGHAQTTSLHAVSAFLSISPSQLREACIRARNAAFYPRVQLKALDFCLSVSLDRLPTSQPRVDEPSVSNSLMAAIKRSQANQRRQPDSLLTLKTQNQHLGQGQEQLGSTSSGIKVELQHLIVSILDDPIVSRVFNDAGFRSFDVKLAILRPFQNFFRYSSRGRGHQGVLLCNLDGHLDPGYRPFRFPFSGNWGSSNQDEDYKRIGDVLVRTKRRNPLLVGVCAHDTLRGFVEILESKKELNILPSELRGMSVISIENDVLRSVSENWSDEAIKLRFREADLMVEHGLGPGLMVSFGNLTCYLGVENGFGMGTLNSVVRKLTKLLEVHGSRVWFIGSAANDQTYTKFLSRFPSIDKDWDLQLVPITTIKPWIGESCFKSSLSFVPFGGFFSSPSDIKCSFSSSYQYDNCANISNEELDGEVTGFSKRGFMHSAADKNQTALSPLLQMAEVGVNNTLEILKANGGPKLQKAKVTGLETKRDNVCQHLPHTQSSLKPENCRNCFKLPTTVGFHHFEEKLKVVNNQSSSATDSSCKECDHAKINSFMPLDLLNHSSSESTNPVLLRSSKNENFLGKLFGGPSKTENPLPGGSQNPRSLFISNDDDSQNSHSSGVSVVTDLGLELFSQPCKQQKKANTDVKSSSEVIKCTIHDQVKFTGDYDADKFKTLFKALFGRVGRQCDAIRHISQIVAHSWTSDGKHQKSALTEDIWLNFIGPDTFGKRKIALALAEILYGSKNNFIHVDLCSKDGIFHQKSGFGPEKICTADVRFRGKTVVDHIADELRKRPFCVVFLENVLSADAMAQRSLLQAMRNGRFSDSHGREIIINNRIFILTSKHIENSTDFSSIKKPPKFSEERIANAEKRPLQILVKGVGNYTNNHYSTLIRTGPDISDLIFLNKRKLNGTDETTEQFVDVDQFKRPNRGLSMSLDLNYPAESSEYDDGIDTGDTDGAYNCGRSESWLEEFADQAAKTLVKVVFETFDHEALAMKILKLINERFYKVVGFKCSLEIEPTVMEQILAAACLLDGDKDVEDWIEQVLSKGFAEAQKRYQLTANSTVILATAAVAMCAEEQVSETCLPLKIILT